jgi:hypothetical protein
MNGASYGGRCVGLTSPYANRLYLILGVCTLFKFLAAEELDQLVLNAKTRRKETASYSGREDVNDSILGQ